MYYVNSTSISLFTIIFGIWTSTTTSTSILKTQDVHKLVDLDDDEDEDVEHSLHNHYQHHLEHHKYPAVESLKIVTRSNP